MSYGEGTVSGVVEKWLESLPATGSLSDGVLWPDLDSAERDRRLFIVREYFPQLQPAVVLATQGVQAALSEAENQSRPQQYRDVVRSYRDFVRIAIEASVDNTFTTDGQNYASRVEAWDDFIAACRRSMVPAPTSVSLPLLVDVLSSAYTDDHGLGIHRMLRQNEQLVISGGAWSADLDWKVRFDLCQLALSWATPPQVLEMLARHPDAQVRSSVLMNPMTRVETLERGLDILPYPTDAWVALDEEEHAVAVLSDITELPEDLIDGVEVGLAWRRALTANPMLPSTVVLGVASSLGGQYLEVPTEAAALLHRACPGHVLARIFLEGTSTAGVVRWTVACVGANPQTPADTLFQFPDLDRSGWVETLEAMDVSVDDVIVGAAVNPSTTPQTRARLAALDSEALALALAATVDHP